MLYVGRARDLRARLRSYFRSERQRPAVEAALGALDRIEWRVLGSELEAALEELRLIRELRPPANARCARPDRYVYLRRRGEQVVCCDAARRRSGRCRAARAPGSPRGRSRARSTMRRRRGAAILRGAARGGSRSDLRFEDAARLRDRDRGARGRRARARRARAAAARSSSACSRPARRAGLPARLLRRKRPRRGVRTLPPGGGARLELEAGLAAARARAEPTLRAEVADELLVSGRSSADRRPSSRSIPLARLAA